MKPINFINPTPPADHRAILFMLRASILLTIALVFVMGSISTYYLLYLKTLKDEVAHIRTQCARFAPRLKEHEQLVMREHALSTQLETATNLHKKQTSPQALINALYRAKPASITLQTVALHNHELVCSCTCADLQSAHTYQNNLTKTSLFARVTMREIRSHGRIYQVTLELACR